MSFDPYAYMTLKWPSNWAISQQTLKLYAKAYFDCGQCDGISKSDQDRFQNVAHPTPEIWPPLIWTKIDVQANLDVLDRFGLQVWPGSLLNLAHHRNLTPSIWTKIDVQANWNGAIDCSLQVWSEPLLNLAHPWNVTFDLYQTRSPH